MSDENKDPKTGGKESNAKENVKIDLNEHKIPDFKLTPPPPPPPTNEPSKTDSNTKDSNK